MIVLLMMLIKCRDSIINDINTAYSIQVETFFLKSKEKLKAAFCNERERVGVVNHGNSVNETVEESASVKIGISLLLFNCFYFSSINFISCEYIPLSFFFAYSFYF